MPTRDSKPGPRKGRGAASQPSARYLEVARESVVDDWPGGEDAGPAPAAPALATTLTWERPKRIISRNRSPDLPFEQSINPYRGCEHGCIYCYARPSHAYLDLSPGLDFESRLVAKANAALVLRGELSAPRYRCSPIVLGANTDAYQPLEKRLGVTREILALLSECRHPVTIVTKSALVERDLDLLVEMAQLGLVRVLFSIATLEDDLARRMEPRASAPRRRLSALRTLARAGIRCGVLVAPIIPALNDNELENILEAAADAGCTQAAYVLLRLPQEVSPLFLEWLQNHYPLKANHVKSLLKDLREGRLNDPNFGTRMSGTGALATLIRARFGKACKRFGLGPSDFSLPTEHFKPPPRNGPVQLELI